MEQELLVYTGLFLLESRERRVLTWHHFYDLAIPSIAEMLGISVGAAKERLEDLDLDTHNKQ